MNKICRGCGVKLQTEFKDKLGYVKNEEMDYCMRCFRLIHYHDYENAFVEKNPKEIIDKVNKRKGFAFFFVDFLNLHEEAITFYKEIQLPKVFVVSKLDLIPKELSFEKIKTWLKEVYHIHEEILFVQEKKMESLKKIMDNIQNQQEKNIFFLGVTNAGKSSILNSFLENNDLTVSSMPNTTLDFLKIDFDDFCIYDTPGLYYHGVSDKLLREANGKGMIHPITYPLKSEATLVIEHTLKIKMNVLNNITWYGVKSLSLEKEYKENTFAFQKEIPENSCVFVKGIGFFIVKNACIMSFDGLKEENISVVPSFRR